MRFDKHSSSDSRAWIRLAVGAYGEVCWLIDVVTGSKRRGLSGLGLMADGTENTL